MPNGYLLLSPFLCLSFVFTRLINWSELFLALFMWSVCLSLSVSLMSFFLFNYPPMFSTRTTEFLVVCIFHFPVPHEVLSFHRLFGFRSRRHSVPVGQLPIILLSKWCVSGKICKSKGSRGSVVPEVRVISSNPVAQFNRGA